MSRWVRFLRDHNARRSPCRLVAYKAGRLLYLPQQTADEVIAKGVAVAIDPPSDQEIAQMGHHSGS